MRPLISLVVLALCACSGAASHPTLQGTVKDPAGTALSGVRATVAGSTAVSDSAGQFSLEVESEGPEKLQLNDSAPMDIPRLEHGAVVHVDVRMADDHHAEMEHAPEVEIEHDGDAA